MKVKVTLSPHPIKSKKEIDPVTENSLMSSDYTRETTISDLAVATGRDGHTWCHASFSGKRKKDNFVRTQLLVADFDDQISYGSVKDRLKEYRLNLTFAYATFGDHLPRNTAEYQQLSEAKRFRLVFALPEPITDIDRYGILLKEGLQKLFPEMDKLSSIQYWFGGKNLIELNDDYTLKPEELFRAACAYQSQNTSSSSAAKRQHKRNIKRQSAFFTDLGSKTAPPYNIYKSDVEIEPAARIRNFDWRQAREQCRLLDEFLGIKRKIWHNELFGLYLGMRLIEGGRMRWKNAVLDNLEVSNNKIRAIADYVDVHDPPYKEMWLKEYVPSDDPVLQKYYKKLTDIHPKKLEHARVLEEKPLITQENAEWALR